MVAKFVFIFLFSGFNGKIKSTYCLFNMILKGRLTMWKEFREFIARGNVLDLAVGIIIGAAFGAIVSSLVDNIIMPLIGLIMGGIDFTNLAFTVGDAEIGYGIFIQNIINFLVIAFSIFMFIRVINKFKKEKEEEVIEEIDEQTEVLKEIRDLLKKES